jgi:guanyl-specific ribonuclease Sa
LTLVRTVRRARRPLVALLALVGALAVGYAVQACTSAAHTAAGTSPAQIRVEPLSALPPEAATTVHLIQDGGPFPYPDNDGAVFHNFEHELPSEPDGYYHEYTVATPGSPDRGTRRIITGAPGEFWYTGDHYETFVRVDVST